MCSQAEALQRPLHIFSPLVLCDGLSTQRDNYQVLHGVTVGNLDRILVDRGTGVEVFGDVVGRRSYRLHVPLVGPSARNDGS